MIQTRIALIESIALFIKDLETRKNFEAFCTLLSNREFQALVNLYDVAGFRNEVPNKRPEAANNGFLRAWAKDFDKYPSLNDFACPLRLLAHIVAETYDTFRIRPTVGKPDSLEADFIPSLDRHVLPLDWSSFCWTSGLDVHSARKALLRSYSYQTQLSLAV